MKRRLSVLLILSFTIVVSGCSVLKSGFSGKHSAKCANGKSKIQNKRFSSKKKKRTKAVLFAATPSPSTRPSAAVSQSTPEKSDHIEIPETDDVGAPKSAENSTPTPEKVHINAPAVTAQNESQPPVEQPVTGNEAKPEVINEDPVEPEPEPRIPVEVSPVASGIVHKKLTGPIDAPKIIFREKEYNVDEDIKFNQFIHFIPNHNVPLYPDSAKQKLSDLAWLLKTHPDKRVYVTGNVGWDNFDESDENRFKYQMDDWGNFRRIIYGRGPEVYGQTLYGLGLNDPDHIRRIDELGIPHVTEAIVGDLMMSRARKVKELLIEMGVNKKQIRTGLGEFFFSADRFVSFVIK